MIKKFTLIIGGLLAMTAVSQESNAEVPQDVNKDNLLGMQVSTGGTVVIELLPNIAPKHVERVKELTAQGFYDGIVFHRVISGFMAQTGDPTGTGMGGSELPDVPAEFSSYRYKRGTVGMARSQNPDSANSQFFICFTNTGCSFLTGQYTVLGQVVEGMEFIDQVAIGEPPETPSKIIKMALAKKDDTPAQPESAAAAAPSEGDAKAE